MRHRTSDGWTVKLPKTGDRAMLVREEHVFDGDPRRPPGSAADLVSAFVRTAALRPQVRLRTVRQETALRDGDGRHLADVVDDDVAVLDGRRIAARFRELEVEIADETDLELLEVLVARLRESGAGPPDPTPKVVRALGPRASLPPEIHIATLAGDATVADVVRRAIASSVERLIRHDPVVRLDTDPEGVHQARVATRRLRSDLRTFRSVLDPQWAQPLRDELGWLGEKLGSVRDGDVLLARMRNRAARLPAQYQSGVRPVLASLGAVRVQAFDELLATIRAERYLELLDRLIDAADAPAFLPGADQPAAEALPALVRRPLRALAKQVGALDDLPAEAVQEITVQKRPLGRVLIDRNVLREVELITLWRIMPGTALRKSLPEIGAGPIYGRSAQILVDERPTVQMLEIVTLPQHHETKR